MASKLIQPVLSAGAAIVWWFIRGTIEALFFDKVIHITPGPAMSALVEYGPPAAFAVLTIWLLVRHSDFRLSYLSFSFPWSLVPIDRAAHLAYEAAERAGVVDLTSHPDSAPEERLRLYIYTFMVDDETELLGARPPSTQLLPIRDTDQSLYPVIGENRFDYLTPRRVAYTNVRIRRSDLNRIIRDYPKQARKFARDHGIKR